MGLTYLWPIIAGKGELANVVLANTLTFRLSDFGSSAYSAPRTARSGVITSTPNYGTENAGTHVREKLDDLVHN